MSLNDREYTRQHRMDPEPAGRPPQSKRWLIIGSLFFLALWVLYQWLGK